MARILGPRCEPTVRVLGDGSGRPFDVLDLARQMTEIGVVRLLYTDISRDGALTGPDFKTNTQLAREPGLAVLASGGVASIEHIEELQLTGVEGVIVGRALYTGAVILSEALAAAAAA